MTFENFSRLTGAELLNDPFISSFEKIETNPKKIKRGDLFIGDSIEDIELALHLEAYAIVSTKNLEIIDEEIAWFKAASLDEVLIKLLRFTLLEKNFRFIYAHSIEFELIKKIADKQKIIFLNDDEKDSYKKIINADEKSIFFSTDKLFLKQIYPEYESIEDLTTEIFNCIKKTLFLSSFSYHDKIYKDIKISPLFLKYLEKSVSFLDSNHIEYDIEKTSFTIHFHPIFVNQNLELKSFGKTEHVLICESDKSLIEKELSFLKKEAPWAKTTHFELSNLSDLDKLKNIEFNFAIIFVKYDTLIEILDKKEKKKQIELF
jgi:ferrochelatase